MSDDELTAPFVGQRLMRIRKALELSQVEICRRTGIKTSTWNNYERGLHRISVDEAYKVIEVAPGIDFDYIYLGDMSGVKYEMAEAIRKVIEAEGNPPPRRAVRKSA